MTSCHEASRAHPDHRAELPRLNRIAGQVDGVRKMIQDGRYCPDILTQLRAVRAALRTVEDSILAAHLNGCVSNVLRVGDTDERTAKIDEIVALFKRYGD